MNKNILLPCLTGKFGSWRFFNVVMKIKDLVNPLTGIQTVPESRKIYRSENLNNILQRLEDAKRISPIESYILNQKDRYFNSLTVAIDGGDPKWYPVAIKKDEKFTNESFEYLNLKFGILELSGNEELFILDGQHRLLGLRAAFKTKKEIGEEEISVMLVNHEESVEGIKRTRRIFVSLNRNAKPVSEGENIILEEDDASAIIARQIVEKYTVFKTRNVIAFNKNLNLTHGKSDLDKFTSILALYHINEILVNNDALYKIKIDNKYVRIRPTDKLISQEYKIVEEFWDEFFHTLPKAKIFSVNPLKFINYKTDNGGLFYLRPIGQEVLAEIYKYFITTDHKDDFKKIKQIEEYLNSDFWNHVLYNPYKESIIRNKGNAVSYVLYMLGYNIPERKLQALRTNYYKNSGDLKLSLPKPLKIAKSIKQDV